MSQKANYYKVGLFAILSFAFLVVFLILLGAGNWLKPTQYAETYFDESVQGLEVGSPVKYRGVTVGKVTTINMVSDVYGRGDKETNKKEARYIYVKFSLTPTSSKKRSRRDALNIMKDNINNGLRTRLATADLVGNVYLSLIFADPKQNPTLPIHWTPDELYIPSVKSTLSRLTDNLENFFSTLTDINYKQVITHFDQLVIETTNTLKDANTQQLSQQLEKSLKQIGDLSQTINTLLTSHKADKISDSLLRDSELLETTLADTSSTMKQLNAMMSRTNMLTASQQKNLGETMSYLKEMSKNLETITNNIKDNPSSLIFGAPSNTMEPTND